VPSPFVPPDPTPAPYSAGRFSNGPVWVDQLAAAKGLALNNAFTSFSLVPGMGINNFAVGGAFTGSGNSNSPALPGIEQQVGLFATLSGFSAPADDLYVMWGGANDIVFSGDILGVTPVEAAGAAAANIAQRIAELESLGAEKFLVLNTPDIGATPLAAKLGPGAAAVLSFASMVLNTALEVELEELKADLGIQVIDFDVFSTITAIIDDPGAFGFDGPPVTGFEALGAGIGPCLDQDVLREEIGKLSETPPDFSANPNKAFLCDPSVDPNRYVFHDVLHPSSATHAILAGDVLAAIPEPATLALVLVGLVSVTVGRKRR
jgi:phospholipase/lecithinase/hemolysin